MKGIDLKRKKERHEKALKALHDLMPDLGQYLMLHQSIEFIENQLKQIKINEILDKS